LKMVTNGFGIAQIDLIENLKWYFLNVLILNIQDLSWLYIHISTSTSTYNDWRSHFVSMIARTQEWRSSDFRSRVENPIFLVPSSDSSTTERRGESPANNDPTGLANLLETWQMIASVTTRPGRNKEKITGRTKIQKTWRPLIMKRYVERQEPMWSNSLILNGSIHSLIVLLCLLSWTNVPAEDSSDSV
jgi:hypothetical protein